jgi:hypothetical protein
MSELYEFLKSLDTEPMDIDTFSECAQKDLDRFVKNIKHLKTLKNKSISLFRWYIMFGYWNESLNFLQEENNGK